MAETPAPRKKRINLALQGGGAHGAFTWGVLDRLLADERLEIEGISGTSAGAMNAAILAQGFAKGGAAGARAALDTFWTGMSEFARFSPIQVSPLDKWRGNWNVDRSLGAMWMEFLKGLFSPYQLNPLNYDPLRDILTKAIDFEAVRAAPIKLFISATNVRTGKIRVFERQDLTIDALLASACLPEVFQAVEIDDQPYWDGGYMGNPAIFPLIYGCDSRDIVIVQINPLLREGTPKSTVEIMNRLNEITFNSALLKEFRAVAFVTKLIEDGWIKDEYRPRLRHMLMHSIRADEALVPLGAASKFNCDWRFLCDLRDRGRDTARQWLGENYIHLGKRATVDLATEYLNPRDS